ncbi:hypothetical protein [Rugamonas aquatica]|uniref:Uncharacterized protein n=1 Tax=Rugamonas aquatica TaxID=2743357 RepID=A0A6A7N4N1_9BURK|nr:hypothetical protein [Rugamonas aquatica]MQA39976.1 hypothetical protein [Rugamonas aquatica]
MVKKSAVPDGGAADFSIFGCVTLTAALYSIAIGLSSRNVAMFGAGVLLSFVFSAAFGFLSTQLPLKHARAFSCTAIAIVFGVHIIERYRRHIVNQREFFEFLRAD